MQNFLSALRKGLLIFSLFAFIQAFSFQVGSPIEVDPATNMSLVSSMAMDPQGNALVVYGPGDENSPGPIYARRISPDGTRSAIINISAITGENGFYPKVKMAKDGRANIAYLTNAPGIHYVQLLPDNSTGATSSFSASFLVNSPYDFDLATNDEGVSFLVFSQDNMGTYLSVAVFNPDGTADPLLTTNVSPGATLGNLQVSVAAIDGNQAIIMVYNLGGLLNEEIYSYLADKGTALTPINAFVIGTTGLNVSADGASQNLAIGLFSNKPLIDREIFGAFYSGSWTTPILQNLDPSINQFQFSCGINASGFGIIGWTEGADNLTLNARTFNNSNFNLPITTISSKCLNLFGFNKLAVSPDGKGYITFVEGDLSNPLNARAVAARYDTSSVGSPWQTYTLASFLSAGILSSVNGAGNVGFLISNPVNLTSQPVTGKLYVVFEQNLLGPTNLKACTRYNRFLSQTDVYNQLNWTNNNTDATVGYRVYRNGQLIATLNANTNCYSDHCPCGCGKNTYQVKAFDDSGNESDAATIRI